MSEFGYIPESPEQSFGNNKGIFTPKDIYDLTRADKYTNYGQLELIETKTWTTTQNIDFTDIQEDIYNVHFLTYQTTAFQTTDSIYLRFYDNGVLKSGASDYQNAAQWGYADGTFGTERSTGTSYMRTTFGGGSNTGATAQAYAYFYNLGDSSKYSFKTSQGVSVTDKSGTDTFIFTFGSNVYPVASVVNGIRLLSFNGWSSGTASLYGIRYS